MEREAYERARAFDTETIIRQNEAIARLRREVDGYEKLVATLKATLADALARAIGSEQCDIQRD